MSVRIQSIVPNELAEALAFMAKECKRSQSYVIYQAVENYLKEQLEDIECGETALRIERESDGEYITLEEAERIASEMRNV